jgi:ABC-type branched-subunit amino acid transport system substrate-binding protein
VTYPTVARIPADIFEPPLTPAAKRRLRLRRASGALASVLAAVGVLWAASILLPDLRCGGLNSGVTRIDDQCIGVTDGSFTYDPPLADPRQKAELAEVQTKIRLENERVRTQAPNEPGESQLPYVRVAVLMPMTTDRRSALSVDQIRASLQGTYLAQYRANNTAEVGDRTPQIELLLANEGSNQQHWRTVVDQLVGLTGGDHPLVAVVGLGVSLPETKLAAEELAKHRVATVGAVLTADSMSSGDDSESSQRGLTFVRVAPSNTDYVQELSRHLDELGGPRRGMVVYDENEDDYTTTLRTAYENKLWKHLLQPYHPQTFRGVLDPSEPLPHFDTIVRNICNARADTVFYAGRVAELKTFIGQLASHDCAGRRSLTILLGHNDLSALEDPDTLGRLTRGKIRILYATTTDAAHWDASPGDAPEGYQPFLSAFRAQFPSPGSDNPSLPDSYAIMHHDAVLVATTAIRRAAGEWEDPVPIPGHVSDELGRLNNEYAVKGASGTLSFSPTTHGWPSREERIPIRSIPPDPLPRNPTP